MTVQRDFRPGAAVLTAGLVLSAVYFLFPSGGDVQLVLYEVFAVASIAGILYGIRRFRPKPALPWYLFAAGQALFFAGDVVFDVYPNWSTPSPADYLYLGGYPLLAAMALMLVASSGGFRRIGAMVDGLIVTLAFAVFQWLFIMAPALHQGGPLGARIVLGGMYPFMDIVLLGAYAGFFASPAWRTPAFLLLVLGAGSQLLGDEANWLSGSTYMNGDWVDWGWMASYLFFGVAALHPSMRELSRPARTDSRHVSRWRIASLAAALLTVPVARVIADARGHIIGIWVFAALGAALAALVLGRLAGILRMLERLRYREEDARRTAESARRLLVEQNARLVEADRLKDEFVALVSHDLRTPLTSIIGYVELALDEDSAPLDAERRGFLEVVARSSDRLLRLVDDLLLAARLQSGRLMLSLDEVDLLALCDQSVIEMRARADQKGVTLTLHGDEPVPARCDRRRLLQILDNLISNGIKFTPAGGSVDVRVQRTGGGSTIEILDTGLGIEPGEEERVFERFYRSPSAVKAEVQGTGLGLFIVRAVVEAHGGTVTASRREEGGSAFRLELPARVQDTSPEPELVA
ncbi:MAG TPA: ATP-binding protein [Gaiellaceae bacterium]|nr:ATP-binding protein [Gaiellaceae bacterium]